MSWQGKVMTTLDPEPIGNGRRFATFEEAMAYANDVKRRWMAVRSIHVEPSLDPVNYRWDPEQHRAVMISRQIGV